jgi:hypoxanthine phosphoribosyltransferase
MQSPSILVKDRYFIPFISSGEIQSKIDILSEKVSGKVRGKNPLFIVVLNGAFIFASDLVRRFDFPLEIAFIRVASYSGTSSSGKVKKIIGLNMDITGRSVVIVEDIIDTGTTMEHLIKMFDEMGAAEVRIATLLFKPAAFTRDYKIDFVGMEIPNDFIVGYGLDYDGYGRNYPDIYKIKE